jgi:hypothetical protein
MLRHDVRRNQKGKIGMKTHKVLVTLLMATGILWMDARPLRADDWQPMEPEGSPEARSGHSMVTLPDGRVVAFGGQAEDYTLFNDLHFFEDCWTPITPENDPPPARKFHKAWVVGDNMYVHGGQTVSELLDDLWRYDVNANTWADITPSGERPRARFGHSTAQLPDGNTLIFAGNDGESDLLDLWRYSPSENLFTKLPYCNLTYSHHSAHIVGDFMFVFGRPNVTAVYDMSIGAWNYAPIGFPISGRAVSTIWKNSQGEDRLSIFGGLDAEGRESATVYEMNLATGEINQRKEPMPFPLIDSAAAPLPRSSEPEGSSVQVKSASGIQPLNETSSTFVPLLIFGGESGDEIIDNTLLFDPIHRLQYTNGPGGVVIGTLIQHVGEDGDGDEVVAQADAGAVFDGWSDGVETAARHDTNVTHHIEAEALFRSEGGVEIAWYAQYGIAPGGDETWADVDLRDPHGKNMSLRDEFVALTNPTNPISLFEIIEIGLGPPCLVYFNPSATNRVYTLQYRPCLTDNTWTNIPGQTRVPGGAQPLTNEPGIDNAGFYRVTVDLPE